MQKFHFSLERVLAWRQVQRDLECATAARLQVELNLLQEQRRQLQAQQQAARPAGGPASEMHTLAAYQTRCRQLDLAIQTEATALQARLNNQQKRVIEADRAVQLLQKLRSDQLAAWQHEAATRQEAFATEAFLNRRTVELKRSPTGT